MEEIFLVRFYFLGWVMNMVYAALSSSLVYVLTGQTKTFQLNFEISKQCKNELHFFVNKNISFTLEYIQINCLCVWHKQIEFLICLNKKYFLMTKFFLSEINVIGRNGYSLLHCLQIWHHFVLKLNAKQSKIFLVDLKISFALVTRK